jgi:hypothetical protein
LVEIGAGYQTAQFLFAFATVLLLSPPFQGGDQGVVSLAKAPDKASPISLPNQQRRHTQPWLAFGESRPTRKEA